MTLIDQHGRKLTKLRLSVIDACNMRCPYCMPDNPVFLKRDQWLSIDELEHITHSLIGLGIKEVRLTGGEPLLRPDFIELAQRLSQLPLEHLSLTTNGVHLTKNLVELKKTKIKKINISLDSLQRNTFKKMSGLDELETVLESIFRAQEMGFEVKVNCVVMKGMNDREILEFVNFSASHQLPVRFLELMRIGVMSKDSTRHYFMSVNEMKEMISHSYHLEKLKDPIDSTSRNYKVGNARIGFIASETDEFCSDCSRLRVDALGSVYSCLFKEHGVSLRNKSTEEIQEIVHIVKNDKPTSRIQSVERSMFSIGG